MYKGKREKIDLLYKNLEHTSSTFLAEEAVFPSWEAAFAIVIGQIFIAYSGQNICTTQGTWLKILGLTLSVVWFILVSLNLQYALHEEKRVKNLYEQLKETIDLRSGPLKSLKFVKPWPEKEDKKNWTWECIFWGTRPKEEFKQPERATKKEWIEDAIKSAWLYRRLLPFFLSIYWMYTLNIWLSIITCFIILCVFFFKFDPKKEGTNKDKNPNPDESR